MYVFLLTFVDESSTRNANIVAVVIQANRDKKKGACQRGSKKISCRICSNCHWPE